MNRNYWIVGAAGVLLLLLGAYYASSKGIPVEAKSAGREAIAEFVDERAKTRLPETHVITMPFTGRIQTIALQEGDQVEADAIVAQISPADLKNEVDEAQAAVDRLEQSIVENKDVSIEDSSYKQALKFVESMVKTVAAAEARKTSGKKWLDYSESFMGRVEELRRSGAKTQDDLDRAQAEYVERRVNYQQDVLVAEAMAAIKAASDFFPQMAKQYISRKGLQTNVLDKQKEEAGARLQQAFLRQERGSMKSPVAGIVLERPVRNEKLMQGGTTLMTIGQLSELEVEADILSQDVTRVEPGDRVEIYGAAVGHDLNEGVAGTVSRVFPSGFTKISSLGVEQQRVRVIVRFGEGVLLPLLAKELGVGFRVRVRIFTDQKENALVVPRSALFRGPDGAWQVFAIRGGRATLQSVKIGLMNDQQVEIVDGIKEGESVILAPESHLTHGMRVAGISM